MSRLFKDKPSSRFYCLLFTQAISGPNSQDFNDWFSARIAKPMSHRFWAPSFPVELCRRNTSRLTHNPHAVQRMTAHSPPSSGPMRLSRPSCLSFLIAFSTPARLNPMASAISSVVIFGDEAISRRIFSALFSLPFSLSFSLSFSLLFSAPAPSATGTLNVTIMNPWRLPTGSPVEVKPVPFSKRSTYKKPHLSSREMGSLLVYASSFHLFRACQTLGQPRTHTIGLITF
jgi:hypothetical protein